MINIIFIISIFTLLLYLIKMSKFNNYYISLSNIKKELFVDMKNIRRCLNYSNIITCGRNKSNIKKKNKILNERKSYLFNEYNHTISKFIKKCYNRNKLYLVVVDTGPDYFTERFIYRKYYSKYKYVQFYFVSGLSKNNTINELIKYEHQIYKDIILFPFISTYYTSSLMVISELKWIKENCKMYKWVIHHQADVYINIKRTIQMLDYTKCNKCCIGRKIINMPVARLNSSVYYIPHHLYSKRTWPTYFSGAIIYFSFQSILVLTDLIGKVHPKIWIDDIYIGLLLEKTDIKLLNIKFKWNPNFPLSNISFYHAIHGLYPSELYYITVNNL